MANETQHGTQRSASLDPQTLDAIVEQAPDAIIAVEVDGSIAFANRTAEELFGFARETLIGQPIEELIPERFRTEHRSDRQTYIDAPRARPMGAGLELRARLADGSELDVDVSLAPVQSTRGTLVVAAIRDASARREAEADRLDLMNSVERQLERERVAADIHDDLIQSVYAVGLGLLAAEHDDTMTKEVALTRARSALNETIAELRAYIRWLRAPDAEATGEQLATRVRSLLGEAPEGLRWVTDFDFDENNLPPDYRRQAYLIAKELISNVHRHAGASEATLSILERDRQLRIEARDNGRGFEPESVPTDSYGLVGLRRRAESLGGSVQLVTAPGESLEATVQFPLPAAT